MADNRQRRAHGKIRNKPAPASNFRFWRIVCHDTTNTTFQPRLCKSYLRQKQAVAWQEPKRPCVGTHNHLFPRQHFLRIYQTLNSTYSFSCYTTPKSLIIGGMLFPMLIAKLTPLYIIHIFCKIKCGVLRGFNLYIRGVVLRLSCCYLVCFANNTSMGGN